MFCCSSSTFRRLLPILALAFLLLSAAPLPQVYAQTEMPPESLQSVIDAARTQSKPILVEIYAPWCPWCRRMQKEVYGNEEVKSYIQEHFTYARLNGDTEKGQHHHKDKTYTSSQLASVLGATGYPTTVFLRPDGTRIGTLPGFIDRPTFLQILEYVGSNAYQRQSFQKFIASQAK